MLGKRMLSLVFALALICSFATPSLAYSRLALPSGPIDVAVGEADPVQFELAPTIYSVYAQPGTVQFKSANYTVSEGGTSKVIYLTRTGGTDGVLTATVGVVTGSGGGTADPPEYTFNEDTVTWPSGDSVDKYVTVLVTDDAEIDSPAPTVVLEITASDPIDRIGSPSQTTLTITDNDGGAFYLNPITVTKAEGDRLAVKVYRTKTGTAAWVDYEVIDGTADADDDYTCSETGTLDFGTSDLSKTFYIDIEDDRDPEEAERFYVDLTDCTSGWTIDTAKNRLTVTIAASDMSTVEFDPTAYTVDEDDDYVTLTLVRDTDEGAASVDWETAEVGDDNAADEDRDYEGDSGTVSFRDGEDTKTIKVYITEDTTVEGDEVFEVILSSPDGAELGHDDTATVTIKDNDGGVFEFSQAAYEADEDAGTATITVKRTGGLTSAATVKYATADGTGKKDVDYRSAQGTLTFAKNVTTQTFTVSLIDDSITDGNKTVKLSLSSPSGGTLGTTKAATLTIKDDDNEVLVVLTVGQSAATIDGRAYTMDTKPYINATARTMVPLRFIAEAFGAIVSWDQTTKAVTIDLGAKRIILTIGRNTALVNGVSVAIDAPPELLVESSRTMVPIRFISENLGAPVVYDNITKQITIRMKR